MDKQQKHRNEEEEEEINMVDFFLSRTPTRTRLHFNQLSQHDHKYSGTFKTQVKKKKRGIVK